MFRVVFRFLLIKRWIMCHICTTIHSYVSLNREHSLDSNRGTSIFFLLICRYKSTNDKQYIEGHRDSGEYHLGTKYSNVKQILTIMYKASPISFIKIK